MWFWLGIWFTNQSFNSIWIGNGLRLCLHKRLECRHKFCRREIQILYITICYDAKLWHQWKLQQRNVYIYLNKQHLFDIGLKKHLDTKATISSLFLSFFAYSIYFLKSNKEYSNQYYWFPSGAWKNLHVVYLCQVYSNSRMMESQCFVERNDDALVSECQFRIWLIIKKTNVSLHNRCELRNKCVSEKDRTQYELRKCIHSILSFVLSFVFGNDTCLPSRKSHLYSI